MTKLRTIDLSLLEEARAHHVRELAQIDAAIAVYHRVAKLAKKADRVVAKVRTRATPTTTQARSTNPAAAHSRAQRAGAKAGTRPIDQVRAFFATHNSHALTFDDVLQRSGVSRSAQVGRFGNTVSAAGATRRMVALVLAQLTKSRELRKTKDGYIAAKLQTTDANGASA